ncbi:MAG: hypothetical protein P8X82_05820 [Gemmatimonadales bacterium]|jgi:hypothetical protein
MSAAAGYTDRFGHSWSIHSKRPKGGTKSVVFKCRNIEMVATEDGIKDVAELPETRLKELYCDAERVLVHEKKKWFIGYRTRMGGRGGKAQAGMCTRFRSETGELRYSKSMLHFRHMSDDELSKHLASAQPARS